MNLFKNLQLEKNSLISKNEIYSMWLITIYVIEIVNNILIYKIAYIILIRY